MNKTLREIAFAQRRMNQILQRVGRQFYRASLEFLIFRLTLENVIHKSVYAPSRKEGKTINSPLHVSTSPYSDAYYSNPLPARERYDFAEMSLRSVLTLEWYWFCIDLVKLLVRSESHGLLRLGGKILYQISERAKR